MLDAPVSKPAFVYRAGVRLADTVVTCAWPDLGSATTDLLFVSHAAWRSPRRRLPRLRGRGRQLLTTGATLTLMGPAGERLRPHALIAAPGRPFVLGDLRIELFSSGHLPGSASLWCERGGRRLVYAGPIGEGAELRPAEAVCVDASWAAAGLELPRRAAAEAAVLEAARDRTASVAPVLLVDPPGLTLAIAHLLAEAGLATRTRRQVLEALAAYRRALGVGRAPAAVQRFSGRLAGDELLLWPAETPVPAPVMKPARRPVVLVGPLAGREAPRWPASATGVPFPFGADAARLAEYVAATGAREAALVGAPDDHLIQRLRAVGISAYRLGPPRQMPLFHPRDP
jgi:hypothetical protein